MAGNREQFAHAVDARVYYGWIMVAVSGLGFFASGPAQSHTIGIFIGPLGDELGLSKTEISSAYGLATLFASFCLPLVGRILDRIGPRRTGLAVTALFGLACLAFSFVPGGLWLAVGFAALRFTGQGALALTCGNLVAQWFDRKRGAAMGLMALGFAVSMAVHPWAAEWLIGAVGWRAAWVWLAVSTWVMLFPVFLLLVFDRPEALDLHPDGAGRGRQEGDEPPPADLSLTLRQALGTSTFYVVAAGMFTGATLVTTLHFYQVSIFESHGLSRELATWIFAVSAIVMVVAMPLFGRLLDRVPTNVMFAGGVLTVSASLVSVAAIDSPSSALVYGVIFGITNACNLTLHTFLWARFFGRRHLGAIQGVGQMIGVFGASLGPLPLGIAYDLGIDDRTMLLSLALFPLACAVLAFFVRDPRVPAAIS